jgi:hypothetical protein
MSKSIRANDGTLLFYCPGCEMSHRINDGWQISGESNNLTVSPSILTRWQPAGTHRPEEEKRCHMFIKEGKIQFLSDCTHKLAGQTVSMEEYK